MDPHDVAFTLLSSDVDIARGVQELLPSDVRSFLYTRSERELIVARDGLEAFPAVFREARLCVILFRAGWGDTKWTRLEQNTIGDRAMDEGTGFLLLVRLDDAKPPSWFPRANLWIDYWTVGPTTTAEHIVARLRSPELLTTRVTARTWDRRPAPIARYQVRQAHTSQQYVPSRPEICDGCTAGVEFRPILRIHLPAHEHWPAISEQLCPRCARDRGVSVMIPPGMTADEVYAPRNPHFREYVRRILKQPILPALSCDADLRRRNVDHIGATYSSHSITLVVSGLSRPQKVSVPVHELERANVRSEAEIINFLKNRLLEALPMEGET